LKVFPLKMDENYRQKKNKCQGFFEKKIKNLYFYQLHTTMLTS